MIAFIPFTFFVLIMISRLSHSYIKAIPNFRALQSMQKHSTAYFPSASHEVDVSAVSDLKFDGDLLILPFYKSNESLKDEKEIIAELKSCIPDLSSNLKTLVSDVLDENVFKGESGSKHVVRVHGSNLSTKYVALVGLGANPKKSAGVEVATVNTLGRSISNIANELKASKVGVALPTSIVTEGVSQLILGVHDGIYNDNRFKKEPEGGFKPPSMKFLHLLGASDSVTTEIAATRSQSSKVASGVKFAKDLVGAPANSKTPLEIVKQARKIAQESGMEISVLGEAECRERNMGGYLAVQQGSKFPPQFIHMTYKPAEPSADVVKVALVGKGLTFDSGGYNLKVGAGSSIELMKFDMGGCGAVLGTAQAIGQIKPKNVEVHFISAVCENMISAEAVRPGDIVTASNGKTIEVINTDAEGRLTLADALVYAESLQVDTIIDLATLTGACVVGLGEKLAGLYSSDLSLRTALEEAARRTDEGIWSLPLEPSYKQHVKSNIADLKNVGAKGGGSITAALFLSEFVEKTSWAHIDMAGPVWDSTANKPTGYGVKMLVDFLLHAKK